MNCGRIEGEGKDLAEGEEEEAGDLQSIAGGWTLANHVNLPITARLDG